jgi:ribosomal protein S3AE
MISADATEDATEAWKQDLADRMEEIIDRKRSSNQGREATLAQYIHILMSRYAFESIQHKTSELYPALLKSVKVESSEQETALALRGQRILKSVVIRVLTTLQLSPSR